MYRGYYSTPARHRFSHLQYFDIGPDRNLAADLLDAHMFVESETFGQLMNQPMAGACSDARALRDAGAVGANRIVRPS